MPTGWNDTGKAGSCQVNERAEGSRQMRGRVARRGHPPLIETSQLITLYALLTSRQQMRPRVELKHLAQDHRHALANLWDRNRAGPFFGLSQDGAFDKSGG